MFLLPFGAGPSAADRKKCHCSGPGAIVSSTVDLPRSFHQEQLEEIIRNLTLTSGGAIIPADNGPPPGSPFPQHMPGAGGASLPVPLVLFAMKEGESDSPGTSWLSDVEVGLKRSLILCCQAVYLLLFLYFVLYLTSSNSVCCCTIHSYYSSYHLSESSSVICVFFLFSWQMFLYFLLTLNLFSSSI